MKTIKFKKVSADDKGLLEQIYRLRLQVYGRECGFIDEKDYPLGLETDEYDKQSIHFAAINSFGEVIGSMRLILADKHIFPFQKHCRYVQLPSGHVPKDIGEISRFVISKELRKRKIFSFRCWPGHTFQKRQGHSPRGFLNHARLVAMGLCGEVVKESRERGITHVYALMEKGLYTLIRYYGFNPQCLGEDVDVYGPVRPYVIPVEDSRHSVNHYYHLSTPDTPPQEILALV